MSEALLKNWQADKQAAEEAKKWNNLPNGERYQNADFRISLAHSAPPSLTRMGQQYCGGQTYWKTQNNFDIMILKYLVDNWDEHSPKIIKMMEDQERKSLQKCQEFIDNLQKKIDESKQGEDADNV